MHAGMQHMHAHTCTCTPEKHQQEKAAWLLKREALQGQLAKEHDTVKEMQRKEQLVGCIQSATGCDAATPDSETAVCHLSS